VGTVGKVPSMTDLLKIKMCPVFICKTSKIKTNKKIKTKTLSKLLIECHFSLNSYLS
jgi:hypothetical protein